ncbi:MAG: GTP-binding protein, partial [archaeon]|nr:GTP-binding protein [archaeon]
MSDEYDYLFKCIVVGDGGCGKTAIVVRFSQGFFQEQYKLTIGVEFAVKTIELINEKKVKLQIWDTGGQERFQYVRPLYYRGSMGAIILFDLTNKESFEHIAKWMEEVRTNAGDIPLLLVGNKSDLVAERQISRAEAEDFAKEFEMYYLESSAKDGTGIGDVFAILSCLMIGIDVPAKYIGGSTGLVDKSGQKMGSPGSIPPPISSPIPQPVSQPNVNFFDTNNRKDINIPKPISSSLPPAFSGDLPDEDLTPQFTNNIPPPQPVSRSIEQDYNISALPIQPKTEPRIPEPIPEPEEWAIPEVPIPKTSFQKVEPQESYTLPSQDEIDASIPIVPKKSPIKPATAVQGPITFDDDSFSEPTKIEQDTAPPPLVFDIPEDNSSPKIEFESDSPPIPQKPATPSFPKAKPAAPPSGFKPKPAAPPAGFKPKPSSLFGKPETVKKSPQAP